MIDIYAGRSLLLYKPKPGEKEHCFVVLCEPHGNPAEVVLANFTTLKPTSDRTLVLDWGDHPYLDHPSAVNYADAIITETGNLQALVAINKEFLLPDCPKETLKRMQQGIIDSDRTPNKVKEFWRTTQNKV